MLCLVFIDKSIPMLKKLRINHYYYYYYYYYYYSVTFYMSNTSVYFKYNCFSFLSDKVVHHNRTIITKNEELI